FHLGRGRRRCSCHLRRSRAGLPGRRRSVLLPAGLHLLVGADLLDRDGRDVPQPDPRRGDVDRLRRRFLREFPGRAAVPLPDRLVPRRHLLDLLRLRRAGRPVHAALPARDQRARARGDGGGRPMNEQNSTETSPAAARAAEAAGAGRRIPENVRNVLVIMTDQHRVDTIGCLGSDCASTTNLDRLGQEGFAFTHAFTPTAICTPARASLLTGKHPITHQVLANPEWNIAYSTALDPSAWTYTQALRDHGYNVGLVGKYHVGPNLPDRFGMDD